MQSRQSGPLLEKLKPLATAKHAPLRVYFEQPQFLVAFLQPQSRQALVRALITPLSPSFINHDRYRIGQIQASAVREHWQSNDMVRK